MYNVVIWWDIGCNLSEPRLSRTKCWCAQRECQPSAASSMPLSLALVVLIVLVLSLVWYVRTHIRGTLYTHETEGLGRPGRSGCLLRCPAAALVTTCIQQEQRQVVLSAGVVVVNRWVVAVCVFCVFSGLALWVQHGTPRKHKIDSNSK